jgi:hypothetical protein
MGFFGALGKIIAGKPVFETTAQKAQPPTNAFVLGAAPIGPKQIPQLQLGRIENRMLSGRYELYVDIVNSSPEQVFLDNMTLFGARKELDSQLRPGETRQHLVYVGRPLTAQPGGYAELRYRKQADGDYFMAYFQIRFERESDGFFKPTVFRQTGPIKDI